MDPMKGGTMKKAAIIALGLGLLFLVIPASAHPGECIADARKPVDIGSDTSFSGEYDCDVNHNTLSITIKAQRRTPGQSWEQIGSMTWSTSNQPAIFRGLIVTGSNCAKDYRTKVTASAAPGPSGPHTGSDTSPILQHTC